MFLTVPEIEPPAASAALIPVVVTPPTTEIRLADWMTGLALNHCAAYLVPSHGPNSA